MPPKNDSTLCACLAIIFDVHGTQ